MLRKNFIKFIVFTLLSISTRHLKAGPLGDSSSLPSSSMNDQGDFIIAGPWRTQIFWKKWFFRLPEKSWKNELLESSFHTGISQRTLKDNSFKAIVCNGEQAFLFTGLYHNDKKVGKWKSIPLSFPNEDLKDRTMNSSIRCTMSPLGHWAILVPDHHTVISEGQTFRLDKEDELLDISANDNIFIVISRSGTLLFINRENKQYDKIKTDINFWEPSSVRLKASKNRAIVADNISSYIIDWRKEHTVPTIETIKKLKIYPTAEDQIPAISLAQDGSWTISGFWGTWLGHEEKITKLNPYISLGRRGGYTFSHSATNGSFVAIGPSDGDMGPIKLLTPEYIEKINFADHKPVKSPGFLSPQISKLNPSDPWWIKSLQLQAAWNILEPNLNSTEPIRIAIIDSGSDLHHSAIAGHFFENPEEFFDQNDNDQNGLIDDIVGFDFVTDQSSPADKFGHGSHVTGILSYPDFDQDIIKLTSLRSLDQHGSSNSIDLARAINYAVDQKVDIINCSWGGGRPTIALKKAFARAHNEGILIVTSAGNDKSNNDNYPVVPALFEGVISVGAIKDSGERASFSNWGKESVDFMAPGVDIWSSYLENSWTYMSGTSMAAPMVTRTLAWLLAILNSSQKMASVSKQNKAQLAYELLCNSSRKRREKDSKCGMIQPQKALQNALDWLED